MSAPVPACEDARLATLRSLKVLDTLPDPEFDGIGEIAKALLDVPIALVSLIDADRQWFKAKTGLEVCETSRDLAFCAHTILGAEPMVIEDSTQDPRFADNPFVTGEPFIRFYAGVPIVVDGHAVGTVCCIDTQPRRPSDRQIKALVALADQAAALLRAHRRAEDFAEGERRFAAFLDHSPGVAFLKDAEGRMRFVNVPFERFFGRSAAEVLGKTDYEWLPKEFADGCARDDANVRTTRQPMDFEETATSGDGEERRWRTFKFPFETNGETWIGGIVADVTEQRSAERKVLEQRDRVVAALQEAETAKAASQLAAARFSQLFDGLPVACFTYGEGGTIHEWNAAAEALWGIQAEDALLASIYDTVVGPENRAWKESVIRRVFAGQTAHGEERREILRDGREVWLLTSTFPLRTPDGRIVGAVSANVDVTERRRMEEALRESESRLRTVLDSLHEGVVVQNSQGKVLLANPSAERILGLSGAQLDLKDPNDPRRLATREDGSDFPVEERPFSVAIRENRPAQALLSYRHPKKGLRWLQLAATPLPTPAGSNPEAAVVSFVDVTKIRKAEERLRQSEAKFRTVVESLQEGLVVQGSQGEFLLWNKSAERILGLTADQLAGRTSLDPRWKTVHEDGSPFPPEDHPTTRALATGETQPTVVMGISRPDGGLRWLLVNAEPMLPDETGRPTSVVASFTDITERKNAEERLRTVVESLHEGLVVEDAEKGIVLHNRSAERIMGLTGDQIKGLAARPEGWKTIHEDGSLFPGSEQPITRALETGEVQPTTIVGIQHPVEGLRWVSVNATPVAPLSCGGPRASVASFLDVSEQREQERFIREQMAQLEVQKTELESMNTKLEGLATTDGLTGLRNHRFFQDFLRRKIDLCRGAGLPISVVLLDVDRFKRYNDDFGHQAGDAVLQGVAAVLEGSVRSGDLVARYGGEEFVLVLPGLDEPGAAAVAERARVRLEDTIFAWRGVTASFGVASLGEASPTAESMIRAADEALYRSKTDGRNRVTCAEGDPAGLLASS